MKTALGWITGLILSLAILSSAHAQDTAVKSVTVPFTLDHNRMIVEAEIMGDNGDWLKVRLWVDIGSPNFILSEPLARDLGIDLSAAAGNVDVPAPTVRIGGMPLKFDGVKSTVMFQPFWLFSATHNDANLPATVLRNYQVVFDYPRRQMTIALPGVSSLAACASRPRFTRRQESFRSTPSSAAIRSASPSTTAPHIRSSTPTD